MWSPARAPVRVQDAMPAAAAGAGGTETRGLCPNGWVLPLEAAETSKQLLGWHTECYDL